MKDLTKGRPGKVILQFAIPIFIGNVFQLLYSLADTRIVGSILGNEALAAVGATSTMNNLIIGFLIGLTNGFAIMTAKSFGAKDFEGLRKNVASSIKLGTIIAVVLTVISVGALKPILGLLNMPDELMASGSSYIRIILLGMITAMFYNICASVLRAIGDTITPLIFLMISTVTNVILDYMLILYGNMGVAGAALATVIAQFLAALMCFIYMWRKYPILHIKWHDFRGDLALTKGLLASGFSMGLMQSFVSLGTVALQSAINTFGTNTIVAHAAARKVTEFFMLPFSVLGMTIATYCGQNLGAGEIERIKKGIKEVTIGAWVWCTLVIMMSYTIAPILVRMITATEIEEVIQTATLYLRVDTLIYYVPAVISIFRNALQGIGDHTTPIFSSAIELVGKVLVVILLTPRLDYMGIILAEPIVWVLMVIPLIIKLVKSPVLQNDKTLSC